MYNAETDVILRKFYRHIRIAQEYKLESLSKDLNISTSYISQWENNKRKLNDDLVYKMLDNFGYNLDTIIQYEKNTEILFLCYLRVSQVLCKP